MAEMIWRRADALKVEDRLVELDFVVGFDDRKKKDIRKTANHAKTLKSIKSRLSMLIALVTGYAVFVTGL